MENHKLLQLYQYACLTWFCVTMYNMILWNTHHNIVKANQTKLGSPVKRNHLFWYAINCPSPELYTSVNTYKKKRTGCSRESSKSIVECMCNLISVRDVHCNSITMPLRKQMMKVSAVMCCRSGILLHTRAMRHALWLSEHTSILCSKY